MSFFSLSRQYHKLIERLLSLSRCVGVEKSWNFKHLKKKLRNVFKGKRERIPCVVDDRCCYCFNINIYQHTHSIFFGLEKKNALGFCMFNSLYKYRHIKPRLYSFFPILSRWVSHHTIWGFSMDLNFTRNLTLVHSFGACKIG